MKQDIPYCQKRGVKVLMSIGGVWSNDADYRVSTEQNGRDFSDFLWGAFGPYNTSWTGPRPFDFNGTHNAVDGFDFDIEIKIGGCNGAIPQTYSLLTSVGRQQAIYCNGRPIPRISSQHVHLGCTSVSISTTVLLHAGIDPKGQA